MNRCNRATSVATSCVPIFTLMARMPRLTMFCAETAAWATASALLMPVCVVMVISVSSGALAFPKTEDRGMLSWRASASSRAVSNAQRAEPSWGNCCFKLAASVLPFTRFPANQRSLRRFKRMARAGLCFAIERGQGSRFAIALCAVRQFDCHQQIVGDRLRPARNAERLPQRYIQVLYRQPANRSVSRQNRSQSLLPQ